MKPTLILGALAVWWLLAAKKTPQTVEIAGSLDTTTAPPVRRQRANRDQSTWRNHP